MTSNERDVLAQLEVRLFGFDGSGSGGAFGDLADRIGKIETEMSEWRGAVRLIRVMAGVLGFSGIAVLLRLIATAPS